MRKASWKWILLPNRIVPYLQLVEMTAVSCKNENEMLGSQGAAGSPFTFIFSIDNISVGGRVILRKHL